MDKQVIIAMGREYGSGGHEIAVKIAEHFDLPLYDRNLLKEVAIRKNLSEEEYLEMQELDERERKLFFSRKVGGHSNSPEQNVANLQFELLRDFAKEGKSFVVVGRCAEYVLKDCDNLITLFINGEELPKIERIMRLHNLSEEDAIDRAKKADKKRREYHDSNCPSDYHWGAADTYDVCISSSYLGVDGTADILIKYIDARIEKF